jgi:hypothetical protein
MVRFYGNIGYGRSVETAPGVAENVVVEKTYYGDIFRLTKDQIASSETVNDELRINIELSIVADDYMHTHLNEIYYIIYQGKRWKVSQVTPDRPRLKFRLGGVYNGPTPSP